MNFFKKKETILEPLEIKQKLLKLIDSEIVALGGGVRKFPHAGIKIHIFAPDETIKGRYETALVETKLLEKAVHDYLKPPRCTEARPFLDITFIDQPGAIHVKQGFGLVYVGEKPAAVINSEAYLELLEGLANVKKMRLRSTTTYIGRCEETRQKDGKIVRKNDLYFLDTREIGGRVSRELKENNSINSSVSRLHAHVEFDKNTGKYFLFDDGSSKGTTILRGGRGLSEDVGRNAGKVLENGDIISFGKARVKFRSARRD